MMSCVVPSGDVTVTVSVRNWPAPRPSPRADRYLAVGHHRRDRRAALLAVVALKNASPHHPYQAGLMQRGCNCIYKSFVVSPFAAIDRIGIVRSIDSNRYGLRRAINDVTVTVSVRNWLSPDLAPQAGRYRPRTPKNHRRSQRTMGAAIVSALNDASPASSSVTLKRPVFLRFQIRHYLLS